MTAIALTPERVLEQAALMPAFPRVVNEVLETIEDENATLGMLAHHIQHDPVITGRIMALASSAAHGARAGVRLRDVQAAVSMVGLSRVRELVLAISLAQFTQDSRLSPHFWMHSIAVAISAQELARHVQVSVDHALVAGLLHDIGQLFEARFYPAAFAEIRAAVVSRKTPICEAEQALLGMDHCQIGRLLGLYWGLPTPIVDAIAHHHHRTWSSPEKLVAVTHVAEVLANALDIAHREDNRVDALSAQACETLGLNWQDDMTSLFGHIEARSAYAFEAFR